MPESATFTIDGFACLGSTVEKWRLTSGTQPFVAEFDMIPEDADTLFEGDLRPLTLKISGGGGANGEAVEFKNLYAIERVPGPVPSDSVARVRVADRRWFWNRLHYRRGFNVRRKTGVRRVIGDGTRETTQTAETVWYAPWSLIDGDISPWAAVDILDDILRYIVTAEAEAGAVPATYEIEPDVGNFNGQESSEQPIENLKLDDPADAALNRILSFIPGASLYLNPEGTIVVYSQAAGDEAEQIEDLTAPTVDTGIIEFIDRRRVRPRAIDILFTREIETRFDVEELELGATTDLFTKDGRWMENVLPVPDYQLELNNGDVVARGTWITFTEALNAWGEHPDAGQITFELIRKASVPFLDLFGALRVGGQRDPDDDWAARIAAIQAHWRKTYRINRRWTDRVAQWKPYRVAIIDPTRGTRAPAIAYGNHSFIPGHRFLVAQARGDSDLSYAVNVQGFENTGSPPDLSENDKPAATVSIVDHDQGIIQINWQVDPSRPFGAIIPGWISDGSGSDGDQIKPTIPGPSADLLDRTRAITFDSVTREGAQPPRVSGDHRLSVILTAIPATSRTNSEIERVRVRPEDVQHLLPEAIRNQPSTGPVLEIRVRPQTLTAIVGWSDDDKELIENAFGVGNGFLFDRDSPLTDLILNYEGVASGRGSMATVARAMAARVWAAWSDRYQGTAAVPLRAGARPQGWMDAVSFQVTPEGRVESVFNLPGDIPQLDMFAYLDRGTRDVMLELATLGRI